MEINNPKFYISSPNVSACPDTAVPEYAFIGRSNVGKSSLINMLTRRKGLAKTSQTPGKTLLINHFSMDDGKWYLVDLPGYGYAARGKSQREQLKNLIDGYILNRRQLTSLFVLVDARHEAQKIDLEFISWLGENGVPFAIIFTKADKLSAKSVNENVEKYKNILGDSWEELPPMFLTSSEKGTGRDEVLEYIYSINKSMTKGCGEESEEQNVK